MKILLNLTLIAQVVVDNNVDLDLFAVLREKACMYANAAQIIGMLSVAVPNLFNAAP